MDLSLGTVVFFPVQFKFKMNIRGTYANTNMLTAVGYQMKCMPCCSDPCHASVLCSHSDAVSLCLAMASLNGSRTASCDTEAH